ncbi:MAG TPA: aminopeptidase, partial [Sphingomonas sp.]|nr:aminopeptidase [Sphingomonas sp.]
MKLWFAAFALLTVAAGEPAVLPDDQAAMKAHVMFLASDAMRGRDTGSPEFDIAAEYVAAQFFAAGLKPAGDKNGYLQRVPLVGYHAADRGDFVVTGKSPAPLVFGTDYIPGADPSAAATSANAGVVLVGQGIVAKQYGRDDYRGADVRGKIVAFFGGAPKSFSPEERAHFSNEATKARLAADRGAIGYLIVDRFGFEREAKAYDRRRVAWVGSDGKGFRPGAPKLGVLSETGADKLFRAAGPRWIDAARRGETGSKGTPVIAPATLA